MKKSSAQSVPVTRVLLVDDQAMIGEAVRRMLLSETDIEYHFCADPTKAVQEAERLRPTVILQDLVMPKIDGMTLVKEFRLNEHTREVPLIVLSTKEDPKIKAEGFANGANDYLVKLPDKVELIARIRHHSKGYINLLQRIEAHLALERSQKALAQELQEAADYVRSLLPPPMKGNIRSDWRFISSSSLGGDAFGHHWLDEDHLAVYLVDVCGHGVGAALLSITVINVLRSQSLPNVEFRDPGRVLKALNDAFPMESHNLMYFTMWCGVYNRRTRELRYSSGGHPPAILIHSQNEVAELKTPHMGIGCFEGMEYKAETCVIPEDATLYVFSDGVYELEGGDGKMMDFEEFVDLLKGLRSDQSPELDQVLEFARTYQGRPNFDDDFSILKIDF